MRREPNLLELFSFGASCMTLLREVEIRQMKPFAIICDTLTQEDELVSCMRIFADNRRYRLVDVMRNLPKSIALSKDDFLFVQYSKENDNSFADLKELVGTGYIDDEPIVSLVCLLFAGYIPDEVIDDFSVIIPSNEVEAFLKSGVRGSLIQGMLKRRETDLLALYSGIKSQYRQEIIARGTVDDTQILYASAAIKAILEGRERTIDELFEAVDIGLEWVEAVRDRSDLPALFVATLYECAGNLYPMVLLEEARLKNRPWRLGVALCTEEFYYLSEELMRLLLKKMGEYAGPTEVKQELVKAGYLEIQGKSRRYYTQKLVLNELNYVRYYKFRRDHIDRVGAAPLVTVIDMKGEQKYAAGNK